MLMSLAVLGSLVSVFLLGAGVALSLIHICMAAKLNGAAIEARAGVDILSDGIVEGSVQISANGQPIVMLTDHQSTGGYAKIATVIPCDIPTLAQVRPGQLVGFRVVTVEEGTAACKKEKDKWAYLKEKIDHD